MANSKNWLGILVITLVFGMTVVGCDDGSGGTDPALNGTWSDGYYTYTLNNGNIIWSYRTTGGGIGTYTGTYTTSGNYITVSMDMGYSIQTVTYQYSINGNTLTLTRTLYDDEEDTMTLTKR